jgi:rubrerythrin
MEIAQLTLKEAVLLSLRAEQECARVFRALGGSVEPADDPVAQIMLRLAAEEERQVRALQVFDADVPWPAVWRLDEPAIARLLREYFPTLFQHAPSSPLSPSVARQRAEQVEREEERFYEALASSTPEESARQFFRQLAADEHATLEQLEVEPAQ